MTNDQNITELVRALAERRNTKTMQRGAPENLGMDLYKHFPAIAQSYLEQEEKLSKITEANEWNKDKIKRMAEESEKQEEKLRIAVEALEYPCPACAKVQNDAAAQGLWIYTEACGKCQKCSKALSRIRSLPNP